jgi:hypothetical protein
MRSPEGDSGSGRRTRIRIGPVLPASVVLLSQNHKQLSILSDDVATRSYRVATFRKRVVLIEGTVPNVSMHEKKFLHLRPISPRDAWKRARICQSLRRALT